MITEQHLAKLRTGIRCRGLQTRTPCDKCGELLVEDDEFYAVIKGDPLVIPADIRRYHAGCKP